MDNTNRAKANHKLCKAVRAAMYTIIEIVLIKRLTKIRNEILKEKIAIRTKQNKVN